MSKKYIDSISISQADVPSVGSRRFFKVSGEKGACFILQVVSDDGKFYNFKTNTFTSVFINENNLKVEMLSDSYKGSVFFPGGSNVNYDVLLLADPATNTFIKNRSSISKRITSVVDTTITFNTITSNSSSYGTISPSTIVSTGSPSKSYSVNTNTNFTLPNAATDENGFGLTLSGVPKESDWVFRKSTNLDGAVTNSLTLKLNDTSDLILGTFLTSVSAGTINGSPYITNVDHSTKTVTLSVAQTLADDVLIDFDARGFAAINDAVGVTLEFVSGTASVSGVVTKTVRNDVAGSATIDLNGTYGISGGDYVSVFGQGYQNDPQSNVVTVTTPSSTAGTILVQQVQDDIRKGTVLTFDGSANEISFSGIVTVKKYPDTNRTISLLLDNFITPGVQG